MAEVLLRAHFRKERLVTQKQGMRVLFISGYADTESLPALKRPDVAFLAKPFQASALTAAVRGLLDRPQPTAERTSV